MRERPALVAMAALALALCAGGGAAVAADVNAQRIIAADKEPGNWLSHGSGHRS